MGGSFYPYIGGENRKFQFSQNSAKIFQKFFAQKFYIPRGVYGASLVKIGEIGSGRLFKSLARASVNLPVSSQEIVESTVDVIFRSMSQLIQRKMSLKHHANDISDF